MIEMGPASRKPLEDKTTVVFLSFYLLLLAFFILLNSISQQEKERTLAAMGSLEATFRSKIPTSVDLEALDNDDKIPSSPNVYQIRLLRIFESDLPLARYAVVNYGNVLRIEVPTEAVFGRETAVVRRNLQPVFEGIAEALSGSPSKSRRELEIILGTGPQLPSLSDEPTLGVARAGALAETLVSAGVPENAVHTGVRPGDPGTVVMTFFSRDLTGDGADFAGPED